MRTEIKMYQQELHHLLKNKELWSRLKGKTIMISGATGMIGTCLTDALMLWNRTVEKQKAKTDEKQKTSHIAIGMAIWEVFSGFMRGLNGWYAK